MADTVSSDELAEWKKLRVSLSEEELLLIQQDCAHRIAALHRFCDDPAFERAQCGNGLLLAILDANARCFLETGKSIVTVRDYLKHKASGDPGTGTIYEMFGSWPRAKNAAGVGKVRQPGPRLLRSNGTRNTKGKGIRWTLEDRVRAVATFREYGCPSAYRLTADDYSDWRVNIWPGVLPDYQRIIGRCKITHPNGKPGEEREFSWAEMNEFAEQLACEEPDEFPTLAHRGALQSTSSKNRTKDLSPWKSTLL
jgi:hypothetical protein